MNKKVLVYGDGGKNKEVAKLIAKCNSSVIIPIEAHDSEIRADERAKVLDEYNGYRKQVIDITTKEDFRQLKRVVTVDISENLIKELSQEDLLRVIIDEITERLKEQRNG